MNLKTTIQEDMKTALRAGEKQRLGAIRLIWAAIQQREVDSREQLNDDQLLELLDKEAKKRRESMTQYEQAQRMDLAEQEQFELSIIEHYLPPALTEAELQQLIQAAVADTDAASIKDMGAVMNSLKPKVQGRADMAKVSQQVRQILQSAQ